MKRTSLVLWFTLGLLSTGAVVGQYDDFEFGYDEYYDEYNYGNWYDEDYGDELEYADEYGYGFDEGDLGFGYDDEAYDYPQDYYMDYDYFDEIPDCEVDEKGEVKLLGIEACDLKIEGADKVVDKLNGGLDGTYKVTGCHDGRPMYQRKDKNGSRLLWYSALYKDWDFNDGDVVVESDIIGYGGDGIAEERPQFVPRDKWNLLGEHSSKGIEENMDFIQVQLEVKCADGSSTKPSDLNYNDPPLGAHPLLTDDEWEAKYAQIYNRYSRKNEPKISAGLVAFVVLCGIGVVLGIPYMIYFKKSPKSKAYSLLNHSRKTLAGHKL